MSLQPRDPDYAARTRESHEAQHLMRTLGMEFLRVAPGEVDVAMPYDLAFCESGGGLHGGTVSAGLDTVCASAAASLTAAEDSVLTAELKVNFLRRAIGDRFRFEGRVVKPGRTLIFTEGKCWAITGEQEKLVGTISATMAVIKGGAGDSA
ncbi:MAG: PaaI family thioesterase [Pseudomonadota bacterium]